LKLPTAIAVGPQRTGTTWLHNVLERTGAVPRGIKETMFFDRYYDRGMPWYASHFSHVPDGVPALEIGASYFHKDEARRRIKEHLPSCRIVCTLRDPVSRLESLYRMHVEYGLIDQAFRSAFEEHPDFKASTQYARHLAAWMQLFGEENVLVLFFDDLKRDPAGYLSRFCEFVGLRLDDPESLLRDADALRDPSTGQEAASPTLGRLGLVVGDWFRKRRMYGVVNAAKKIGLKRVFFGSGRPIPPLARDDVRLILDYCQPELDALEALTGRDLSAWRTRAALSNGTR
jgi:LPS sulfotransferase NodH